MIAGSIEEAEKTCNRMSADGWVLVSAFPETFNECCSGTVRKTVLIFAYPEE